MKFVVAKPLFLVRPDYLVAWMGICVISMSKKVALLPFE